MNKTAITPILSIATLITVRENNFLRKKFPAIGSGSRLRALVFIGANPEIRPSELAEGLGVTKASATGLVEALVKEGLVKVGPDKKDRRVLHLSITATGLGLLKKAVPAHTKFLGTLLPEDESTAYRLEAWAELIKSR